MKTRADGRWKGDVPVPAPEGMILIRRDEAAAVVGCSPRTITRWVNDGSLVKYLDKLGRVRFDRDAVEGIGAVWVKQPGHDREPEPGYPDGPARAVPRRW